MNQFFVRQWKDVPDVPWWYNERASVGLLAAALWKTGGYAFEEYSTKKKGKVGRVDLEFGTGNEVFVAEAKQCWIRNMGKTDPTNRIKQSFKAATEDVKRCNTMGMGKLAIVFGVPSMNEADSDLAFRENVAHFLDYANEVDAGAMAWVFPGSKCQPTIGGKIYPGVVVWIKEVA
ncbi:MAG: hypothetical protein K9L89_06180 [Kiritimatiellales bacterium]|nr:hypothetical protein [Kiritimatiellales bacterium]